MADWLKGFDPLKGVDLLGSQSRGKATDGFHTGWKIATTINRILAGRRARKRMEQDAARERDRIKDAIENPPPIHGSARWARAIDLARADMLRQGDAFDHPSSLLLGVFSDPDLDGAIAGQVHWDGEGHLITVAPTRSGKSTTTIVPNLLRYRGSCVVLDPKGELYRETATWRRSVGPVYRIAPFAGGTDGFNPMKSVETFSDARDLASLLMPHDPKAVEFFRNDAIAFLTAVILFVNQYAPEDRRTLQEVRNILAGPVRELVETAEDMVATNNPALANPASTVLGKRQDAMTTLRGTFNSELAIWDDPDVARAVSGTLDFRSLKDAPATVYIEVPFNKMASYAPFLKVALTGALDAMLRNPRQPDIPVLFVLDEFLSLGRFPQFLDAIRTHAGAGVRLWFFLQNLSKIEEYYPESWKGFFDAAVKVFFGTKDAYTGRLISETVLGNTTIAYFNGGVSASGSVSTGDILDRNANAGTSVSANVNYALRPLLTPTEVVSRLSGEFADRSREGILAVDGVEHPVALRMVPWFLSKRCRERHSTPPTLP